MKKLTCYSPYNVNNNLYVQNVKSLIESDEIEVISIREVLRNFKTFHKCNVFNLNWFENIEGDNFLKVYANYFVKILLIIWLKINRKKIIYTIHNKKPHNIKNGKLSIKIMTILCKHADIILGMCSDTESVINSIDKKYINKLQVILHPNYIKNYNLLEQENYKRIYNIKDSDLVFMFFGGISPYKNIEMLIDIFNEFKDCNMKLLIAGKPVNSEYKSDIMNRIGQNSNIIYDLRFIEDYELVKFYNTSDIVILPYKKDSSLNSGAVYLSFSLKKTVIVPRIGTINSLSDDSFVYYYDYSDEKQHYNELKKQIIKVYNDFKNNKDYIKNCGKYAYNYVSKFHSDEIIRNMYKEIYGKLI